MAVLHSPVKLKVVGQGQDKAQGKTKIFDTMRHIHCSNNYPMMWVLFVFQICRFLYEEHTRDRYIDPSHHNFENCLLPCFETSQLLGSAIGSSRPAQAALRNETWKETIFKIMLGRINVSISSVMKNDNCQVPLGINTSTCQIKVRK